MSPGDRRRSEAAAASEAGMGSKTCHIPPFYVATIERLKAV